MLVIRLRRTGKKNKPSYRIVVAEHSFPIDGRFVEDLGFYNPHNKKTSLDKDKALDWMKKGARPSNTVAKVLESEKVKHGSVVVIKKSKKPKNVAEEKTTKPAPAPAAETTEETTPEQVEESTEPTATEEAPAPEAVAEEPAA